MSLAKRHVEAWVCEKQMKETNKETVRIELEWRQPMHRIKVENRFITGVVRATMVVLVPMLNLNVYAIEKMFFDF